jgi:shikimate kinase
VVGGLLETPTAGRSRSAAAACSRSGSAPALDRHIVVWLQVDAEEAWRRIEGTDRPLARSAEDVDALLAARLPLYESWPMRRAPGIRQIAGRCRRSWR